MEPVIRVQLAVRDDDMRRPVVAAEQVADRLADRRAGDEWQLCDVVAEDNSVHVAIEVRSAAPGRGRLFQPVQRHRQTGRVGRLRPGPALIARLQHCGEPLVVVRRPPRREITGPTHATVRIALQVQRLSEGGEAVTFAVRDDPEVAHVDGGERSASAVQTGHQLAGTHDAVEGRLPGMCKGQRGAQS